MNERPFREIALILTVMTIVGLVTVAIIITLRGGVPGSPLIMQTPFLTATSSAIGIPSPYPGPLGYRMLTETDLQTEAVPRFTQKAIMLATYLATTPSPTPQKTFPPTGTVENMYTKPSGEKLGLDAQNGWFGLLDGYQVDLTAGALIGDPNQGAVYLFVAIPRSGVSELILTPTKHGGIRVVSEQNNRLMMISTDGTTYYFDVPARRFVDSLTEMVPTATLLPTITPPSIPYPIPSPPTPYPLPSEDSYPGPI